MGLMEAVLWLALNIYHEARSEDQMAQIAVAHVTLNRSRQHKKSVKTVVLENSQFSWTILKSKKDWAPKDLRAFQQCMESAYIALNGHDFTQGSTFYHERKIRPYWAKEYIYVADFGSHRFYRRR